MFEIKDISEDLRSQIQAGAKIVNFADDVAASLILDRSLDIRGKILIFSPEQKIEFGSRLNLEGSALFLNGATALGLENSDKYVLVRGRLPLTMLDFTYDGEFGFNHSVPVPIQHAFKSRYEDLFIERRGMRLDFIDPLQGTSGRLERFITECNFYRLNQQIPVENIGCSLDNYDPKNESQKLAKDAALKLLSFQNPSKAAGLFLEGLPGVGKTHLAVAMALEFMMQGWPTHFIAATTNRGINNLLNDRQPAAWILDDLNSPYAQGMDTFKKLIVHIHETGGRLFVTSNTSLQQLLEHGFVTDRDEKPRILDRFKGMMMALRVEGESFRSESPWYADET